MVFHCKLCEEETVITVHLCDSCRRIKHIMTCYTREIVYDVLEKVLIRNEDQRNYKIKNYKKPVLDDSSYLDKEEEERKLINHKNHQMIKKEILDKFSK